MSAANISMNARSTTPTAEARNDEDAKRLWEISEKIAGL